jgi:hypothetical protein
MWQARRSVAISRRSCARVLLSETTKTLGGQLKTGENRLARLRVPGKGHVGTSPDSIADVAEAMLICAPGLYGLVAFLVAQRMREIAIRMGLGASEAAVQGMVVLRQAGCLGLAGTGLGAGLALGFARLVVAPDRSGPFPVVGRVGLLDLRMHDDQPEQLLERFEVAVAVEKRMAFSDAECRDQAVNGLTNGPSSRSQDTVVPGSRRRKLDTASLECLKTSQIPENARRIFIGRETLQDLADHQVEQAKGLTRELAVEPLRFGCRDVVQVVDPHSGIYDDHRAQRLAASRVRRLSSRSPRHVTFPRRRRIRD